MKKIMFKFTALIIWAIILSLLVVGFSGCTPVYAKPEPVPESKPIVLDYGPEPEPIYPHNENGVICYCIRPDGVGVLVDSGGTCLSTMMLGYIMYLEDLLGEGPHSVLSF